MDPTKEKHQILCRSWKNAMEILALIRQAFREESVSRRQKVQTHRAWEKWRQVKSKVKGMLIIFFGFKGVVRKEFILAGQTVNSAYYCVVLRRLCENVRRLCPNL
jgi:hypothetical protein